MGVKSLVKHILTEQQNKKYARLLASKQISYDAWIKKQEQAYAWKDTCDCPEDGGYVCFVMPGGQLAAGALGTMAKYFARLPEAMILYGDEDIMEPAGGMQGGVRRSPWFKPDWSPDLLNCSFYFGSMVAVRRELWEKEGEGFVLADRGLEACGDDTATFVYRIVDIPRFQSFIRDCVRRAGGYRQGSQAVLHVPEILFHCDSEAEWEAYKVQEFADKALGINSGADADSNISGRIEGKLLSIIIPSKDNPDILEKCLRAIPAAAGKLPYEIILVDNGSKEENRCRIETLMQSIAGSAENDRNEQVITYLYRPQEFHFSKMCNLGADAAKGDLLLFLNDDVELAQEGSLERMARLAVQEYTGAVGIKLYYPDSVRIQHAGITNLPMGPVHKLQFLEDDEEYYFSYNRGKRNVLAVTAACLMVEKDKFSQAGGFAEELRVAFNDVDLCFQLYGLGYYNVCRNDCFAYHHESLSRGDDESAEKLQRLLSERDKLYERNPQLVNVDPYYGPGLGREGLDTRIRPAYETAGNKVQQPTGDLQEMNLADYRQDNCLLFRVEDCTGAVAQGYGVVLGDNNACYDRWLVLQAVYQEEASAVACCYALKVEEQYRPDLVENMTDQTNVGLCGYRVRLFANNLSGGKAPLISIPAGSYRLGMAVRNRITGLKLINWSNRRIAINKTRN